MSLSTTIQSIVAAYVESLAASLKKLQLSQVFLLYLMALSVSQATQCIAGVATALIAHVTGSARASCL